jgi:hypothetical protein
MLEETFLRELRLNGKPLPECEMELESSRGNYRLYSDKGDRAFWTLAVEFYSASADFKNPWDDPDVMVAPLFNTTAYFDGVRHLEFNREAGDMAGYIYYPNMDGIISLLQKVRELELKICPNCDR